MVYRNFLLIVVLLILLASGVTRAQDAVSSAGPSLTLDQAVDLALRHNRAVKVAELGVERADEDIAAAKTFRLPALHAYTLVSRNLANNELKVRNPTADIFPGLGEFFTLSVTQRTTANFAATAIQPLSQQYRIGLNLKLQRVSRAGAQANLRLQKQEIVDQVKKAYYSILETKSALDSVQEAVKSYQELNKVTGDYVVQQVVLRADHLVVQTRLAKAEYEELELGTHLATQKEQLNKLLGRSVTAEFEVADVPSLVTVETDLAAARKIALERRPELEQAKLLVERATLERRIKKSEYIPDVSAGFVYLTNRNFDPSVPKNFANVGVIVKWEFFDWGRKRHQLVEKDKAVEQAKNDLKETEDQVLIDVGDKLRKLQLSGQLLQVAKLAQDAARENLRVSTGQYKFQAVMLSDVLKSQASLAESTHEYKSALLNFWTARAEYEKALGEDK